MLNIVLNEGNNKITKPANQLAGLYMMPTLAFNELNGFWRGFQTISWGIKVDQFTWIRLMIEIWGQSLIALFSTLNSLEKTILKIITSMTRKREY